jgi:Zn-dependent protease with chaperone function
MVCPWCGSAVDPNRKFCCGRLLVGDSQPVCNLQLTVAEAPSLPPEEYALASDLTLGKIASKIPVLPSIAGMFISRWSKPVERAKLLGDGIRITPRQSPSLHSILVEAAARVGVPCPELFIKQDPTFSAYTMGTNEDHVIVMHSGLFDAGEPDELQFILGHELGHIRNHHVTNMTIARFLANGVSGIVEVLALPLEVLAAPLVVALDAWSREAEKTADRAGYLATLSPDASLRALVLLAAGSRKLMSEMNLSEYLSQREGLNTAQAKLHLWLGGYDHPHLVERAHSLVEFIGSPLGKSATRKMSAQYGEARRRLEEDQRTSSGSGLDSIKCLASGSAAPSFCRSCGFELSGTSGICNVCSTPES